MPYTWMQCMTRAAVWVFVYVDELVSKPVYVYVCALSQRVHLCRCVQLNIAWVSKYMMVEVSEGGHSIDISMSR